MYGGHITDDWDRRLCKTYLEEYMHPDQLDGELRLAPGRDLYIAKNQKLCQNQNSKWSGQYYRYYITMYDFNHIIQFSIPIWSWIFKRKHGIMTFFTFLFKCGQGCTLI